MHSSSFHSVINKLTDSLEIHINKPIRSLLYHLQDIRRPSATSESNGVVISDEDRDKDKNVHPIAETVAVESGSTTVAADVAAPKKAKKKTVTFKNVLETSDDITVKKVYNPAGTPLVPIIKKDSSIRSMESIVKPSRLTEIVKQSSFNNLNRIKTLTFETADDRDEDEDEEDRQTGAAVEKPDVPLDEGDNVEEDEDDTASTGNVAVGAKRFILPKRSLHSRRVIKPNKKFLDDMDGCSAKALKRVNSGSKTKSVIKTEVDENNSLAPAATTSGKTVKSEPKDQSHVEGLKKEKDLATKEVSNLFGQPVSSVGGELNLTPFGSNKVILRQPRLQFAMPASTPVTSATNNNLFGFTSTSGLNNTDANGGGVSGISQSVAIPLKGSSLRANGEFYN